MSCSLSANETGSEDIGAGRPSQHLRDTRQSLAGIGDASGCRFPAIATGASSALDSVRFLSSSLPAVRGGVDYGSRSTVSSGQPAYPPRSGRSARVVHAIPCPCPFRRPPDTGPRRPSPGVPGRPVVNVRQERDHFHSDESVSTPGGPRSDSLIGIFNWYRRDPGCAVNTRLKCGTSRPAVCWERPWISRNGVEDRKNIRHTARHETACLVGASACQRGCGETMIRRTMHSPPQDEEPVSHGDAHERSGRTERETARGGR